MSNLTDIEARLATDRDDFGGGYADQSIRDRETLLGMVRELETKVSRARGLVSTWSEYPSSPEGSCAFELRMAVGEA